MKIKLSIILGILLCTALPGYSQCRVQFRLIDCRDTLRESYDMPEDSILVYRRVSDRIEGFITRLGWDGTDTVVLPEPGSYHLVFSNILGRKTDRVVRITESGPMELLVCGDSIDYYGNEEYRGLGRLSRLDTGERVVVRLERRGCFEYRVEQIEITKETDGYHARQYELEYRTRKDRQTGGWKKEFRRGVLLQETMLQSRHLDAFSRFENELQQVTSLGCTTSDHYTLYAPYTTPVDRIDGSCAWWGYDALDAAFFPEREE